MTTDLPAFIAASSSERAGSMPPMTSITMSVSGLATSSTASVVSSARSIPAARCRCSRRTAIPVTSTGAPILAVRSAACSRSSLTTCEPTTPQPSRATFSGLFRSVAPRWLLPSPGAVPSPGVQPDQASIVSRRTSTRAAPSPHRRHGGRGTWL